MPANKFTYVTCDTCRYTFGPDTSDVNIGLIQQHQTTLNHHGRRWEIINPSTPPQPQPQPEQQQKNYIALSRFWSGISPKPYPDNDNANRSRAALNGMLHRGWQHAPGRMIHRQTGDIILCGCPDCRPDAYASQP